MLYAASTTDALFSLDGILEVGGLHKLPNQGTGGAQLVFGSLITGLMVDLEIAGAKVAIAADTVFLEAAGR
jgi:hypothetical protein